MLGAYLELARPANVATALGDVLAGYAVARLAGPDALPWLLAATACLYAGGVVLNDVFDRKVDAVERPERPLPSGTVSAGGAATLGVLLLGVGVLNAFLGTPEAGLVGLGIVAAVLLYDGWSKKNPVLGPINMGACRGLNLGLGMTAVPGTLAVHWPLCLIPLTYIAGVTLLSRGEVSGGRHSTGTVSLLLVVGSVGALLLAAIYINLHVLPAVVATVLFAWRVVPSVLAARRNPTPGAVRAAVKRGVLSLVLLDAALATAFAGVGYGLVLLAAALVAVWLGRRFSVT